MRWRDEIMMRWNKTAAGFALPVFLIVSGMSLAASGAGEYPEVRATVKPEKATVGVPLEYVIAISGKDLGGVDMVLPGEKEYYPETALKEGKDAGNAGKVPLYIIHSARKKTGGGKNNSSLALILELSFYRPGKHPLPDLEIYDRDRVRIGYRVPEIVIDAVNENGEFQDIEPPLDLSGNYYRLLLLSGALTAAVAGAWFVIARVKKMRESTEAPAPETPPIDIFMKEIHSLKRRGLIEEGKAGEFALELSRIFRAFLSAHFRTDAMEMTSLDMLAFLQRCLPGPVFKNTESDLHRVLEMWDLAKFAGFAPEPAALSSNLEQALLAGRIIAREGLRVRD